MSHPNKKSSTVTLDVTFEIEGSVSAKEIQHITNNILQKYRDDVGFQFNDEDSFVEGIIVTPKQA